MDIVINEQLRAYIDPLTAEEHAALERSLLAEGCRDALVLWGNVLVDGHNRYGICQQHGLPFRTVQNPRFRSIEDVHLWMIDQHLGRRSVSDFQRGVLALRKREILEQRRREALQAIAAMAPSAAAEEVSEPAAPTPADDLSPASGLDSREALAKAARLSNSQVVLIEKIHRQAAPELVEAVKAGHISISAAATVATLPEDEQRAAAMAGKDELRQVARRVRESRRKPREAKPAEAQHDGAEAAAGADSATGDELQQLRQRVAELSAENAELRRQLAQLQALDV